jgi:hypothetical protein
MKNYVSIENLTGTSTLYKIKAITQVHVAKPTYQLCHYGQLPYIIQNHIFQ